MDLWKSPKDILKEALEAIDSAGRAIKKMQQHAVLPDPSPIPSNDVPISYLLFAQYMLMLMDGKYLEAGHYFDRFQCQREFESKRSDK